MVSNIVLISSKYVILFVFLLFVFVSFKALREGSEEKKSISVALQRIFLIVFHAVSFLCIIIHASTDNLSFTMGQAIGLWAGQFAYLIAMSCIVPHFVSLSKGLNNVMCMLLSIGFVIQTRLSFTQSVRLFLIVIASSVIFLIFVFLCKRAKFLRNLTWIYCAAGIVLLLLVFILANFTKGAKMSLDLGFFSFQPMEFVKIIFVMFIASAFYKANTLKTVLITAGFAALHIIILVLCKDLGSALILFVIYVLMLYVATKKVLYMCISVGAFACAAVAAYMLFSHVRVRVEAWLNPWADIDDKGYQIAQSLFSIGSGGWFGSGIFNGVPKYVPEVDNDMVFSAICEELGTIFGLLLIVLILCMILMIMRVAIRVENIFYKLLAFGLGTSIAIQTFLTIGGTLKFIPLTGVNLIFISNGGSSMLASMVMLGIIQALYVISEADIEREKVEIENGAGIIQINQEDIATISSRVKQVEYKDIPESNDNQ